MRTIRKILDLKDESIRYINDSELSICVQHIRHTPVHFHASAVELIYCLDGEVNICCNHEIVTLKGGQIFTVDFEDIHCLYSDKDNTVITLHIDLKKSKKPWDYLQYVYFSCEDTSCRPYQRRPLQQIKDLLLSTAYLYIKKGDLTEHEISFASHKITELLLDYFDWYNYINVYPNSNDEIRERFQQIVAFCQENYMKKVTISQLAKTVHINENYFSQFVKASPYGSFSRMIGYIRCYASQPLLLSSELSVIEISNQCGFSDDKYYYKNFRFFFGKTPNQYRQWFKDYLKNPDSITDIPASDACLILEPYVAGYFSHNILTSL